MAITRADTITQTVKKIETYSDFTNNFQKHPVTNQLVTLKNEDAVRQAFKNLILTNIGERLFNPFFGSNVRNSLFEQTSAFLIEDITRYVKVSAAQFEPRVQLLNVQVLDSVDLNGISVSITFALINRPEPINLTFFLRRVR
jgi:phage baseplate assembly protein W